MEHLVIGLDFGSDSVRAILVDANGRQLNSHAHSYHRWSQNLYSDAAISCFRQHPLDYLESMEIVLKNAIANINPDAIRAIGIDCTGSTPCVTDNSGTPLALLPEFSDDPDAMFLLWKDHTSITEAERINDIAHNHSPVDYTKFSGGCYSPEWFWSKLFHVLRVNPRIREAAGGFVEHCDWIASELTGQPIKAGRCAAGHKAMFHPSWGGLPPEEFWCQVSPLIRNWRSKLYNETFTADIPVGTLSEKWASKLGLSTKIIVAGGLIDAHAGAVGAGIKPGEMVKVVGTSTCDMIVCSHLEHCVKGICGQVDGSIIPGMVGLEAGQSAFGDIYAWFTRLISFNGEVDIAKLEAQAAALPINEELVALDWWNGRRNPDSNLLLLGAIFGLNLGTTAPMIFRTLVEATAFGSKRIIERFRAEQVPVNSVIAVGGIARKSPFVMQTCADVLNMPIKVAKSDQACALGAAMYGAVAAGIYPDLATASQAMSSGFDLEYQPIPENVAIYQRLYKRYLTLGAAVEQENNQRKS